MKDFAERMAHFYTDHRFALCLLLLLEEAVVIELLACHRVKGNVSKKAGAPF